MNLEDWFLFVLTFISGVVVGGLIYVTAFKPLYAPEELSVAEDLAMEFSVVGQSYGGLRANAAHPSFRTLEDGSFTFRTGVSDGQLTEPLPGVLPRSLTRRLVDAVEVAPLTAYSAPAQGKECRIAVDGIDYEYQIILDRVSYQIDTCTTAIPYDSELNEALEAIWQYFSDPGSYEGERGGFVPLSELLERSLNKRFNNE